MATDSGNEKKGILANALERHQGKGRKTVKRRIKVRMGRKPRGR